MKSARKSAAQTETPKTKRSKPKRASAKGQPPAPAKHKHTREELRAELMQEAASVVDELLDWHEDDQHIAPTLSEIEDVILQLRKRLSAKMAEVVIQDQGAVQLVPGPQCPTCGREMHYKGLKENVVETRVGTVPTQRAYYYCEACRRGLFPPGSPTEAVGRPLE